MNNKVRRYAKYILFLMSILWVIPYMQSRHCHSHHHGRRYCGGGGYWAAGWGYPYPGWGYAWPYWYGAPYYGPTVSVGFSSGDRTVRVVDRTYRVTNRTERVVRVSTSRESKVVQPGDTVRLKYVQKVMTIASEDSRERVKVKPRSRNVTIIEDENGTLRIRD